MLSNKLKKGDTIGVIAPSNTADEDDREEIDNSIKLMQSAGFKVKLGKYVYSHTLSYGATVDEKIEDIHEMFKDKEIKAIFCVKGGEDSNSLFDYLDYELIKQNPKIICGFSDSTSITNMIFQKTGLVTFNGPTFKSLTSWETNYGYTEVIKRFVDGNLELGKKDDKYKTIKEGKTEGKLVGGNLSLLAGMVSGKYSIDFQDKILFVEELGFETDPNGVNRYFSLMKQNEVFGKIKGIWVGNYTHESGVKIEDILLKVLDGKYDIPIIKSENFGHIDKKTVIPIGTKAMIDTTKDKKIKLVEKCVK